jgi:putative AdoMet-dependent methyltransferase
MSADDPFPSRDFDQWAETYDQDVVSYNRFPFDGYEHVLAEVVRQADAHGGQSVLDIGTGTGALAERFAALGCEMWCMDFSPAMLERARTKLPQAHLLLHDMRTPLPGPLERRFDRIVSAYVFHHLELDGKVALCRTLVRNHVEPGGKLIVADLSFPSRQAEQAFAQSVGELWEQEPYWLADQALPAFKRAGLTPAYLQVSACAGLYSFPG